MSAGEQPERELLAQRRRKLAALRERGNAYPNGFRRQSRADELAAEHGAKSKAELAAVPVATSVAGRLRLRRVMGKASFVTIADETGSIQCYLREDDLGAAYEDFRGLWDLGDIVGVAGTLMKTNKGELTVQASAVQLLAKALRPPPEKFHGLADTETRYRQRYLELAANPDSRAVFRVRAAVIRQLRRFFDERGFLEVETPMMHPIPGGAAARPFVTRHNALDADLYLRVAPELYLKRLVVGGFEKVYELNRCFRNEGLSARHSPEFTTVEFYQAYADYADMMDLTEALLRSVVRAVGGDETLAHQGRTLDFGKPIPRLPMLTAVAKAVGVAEARLEEVASLRALAKRFGIVPAAGWGWGRLLMALFESQVEATLLQPTFIVGYPAEVSPLARRNERNPLLADRFELFVAGREVANGFSELNDPEDQARRFEEQAALKAEGDLEAMHFDQDYLTALEYGMPPTAGEGIGIDRLAMLLTDSPSIRDVLLFPQLRPEPKPPQGSRRRTP